MWKPESLHHNRAAYRQEKDTCRFPRTQERFLALSFYLCRLLDSIDECRGFLIVGRSLRPGRALVRSRSRTVKRQPPRPPRLPRNDVLDELERDTAREATLGRSRRSRSACTNRPPTTSAGQTVHGTRPGKGCSRADSRSLRQHRVLKTIRHRQRMLKASHDVQACTRTQHLPFRLAVR